MYRHRAALPLLPSAPLAPLSTAVAAYAAEAAASYTATGGTGSASSSLSASPTHARSSTLALYRATLRSLPSIRQNYALLETEPALRAGIRDLFGKRLPPAADAGKVLDMYLFKGKQELLEFQAQWKSRTHAMAYVAAFEEAAERRRDAEIEAAAATEKEGGMMAAAVTEARGEGVRRAEVLREWRAKGLVPEKVLSWDAYVRWSADQEAKHVRFALENDIFTKEELQANKKLEREQGCAIM